MHASLATRAAGITHLARIAQTASIAPSPTASYPNVTLSLSKGAPQDIAAAVLFREILEPLAAGLGPVGEIALGAVADELCMRSRR